MNGIDQLIERRDHALEQFATIGDMHPGTLPQTSPSAATRAAAALTTIRPGTAPTT